MAMHPHSVPYNVLSLTCIPLAQLEEAFGSDFWHAFATGVPETHRAQAAQRPKPETFNPKLGTPLDISLMKFAAEFSTTA